MLTSSDLPLPDNVGDVSAETETSLLDRLLAVKPADLTRNAWAVKAGVSRSVWTDIRNRNSAERATIEALLEIAGLSYDEWASEGRRVATEVAVAAGTEDVRGAFYAEGQGRPLELLGTAMGGEYSDIDDQVELTELWYTQVVGRIARPESLAHDDKAYALTIFGDSMIPRYRPSERVGVSTKAAIAIGDDVIVQLRSPDGDDGERVTMVLIKELVRRTASYYELRQYNPPLTFRVPAERVARIHKVTTNFF